MGIKPMMRNHDLVAIMIAEFQLFLNSGLQTLLNMKWEYYSS